MSGESAVPLIDVPGRVPEVPTSLPREDSVCVDEYGDLPSGNYVPSGLGSVGSIYGSVSKSARLGIPSLP